MPGGANAVVVGVNFPLSKRLIREKGAPEVFNITITNPYSVPIVFLFQEVEADTPIKARLCQMPFSKVSDPRLAFWREPDAEGAIGVFLNFRVDVGGLHEFNGHDLLTFTCVIFALMMSKCPAPLPSGSQKIQAVRRIPSLERNTSP